MNPWSFFFIGYVFSQPLKPAAGRISDTIPFRRSAILAERFLSYGNEIFIR